MGASLVHRCSQVSQELDGLIEIVRNAWVDFCNQTVNRVATQLF